MPEETFPITIHTHLSQKYPVIDIPFNVHCAHCDHHLFTRSIIIGDYIICKCSNCKEFSSIIHVIQKFEIQPS